MKAVFKQQWLDALRSGRYTEAYGIWIDLSCPMRGCAVGVLMMELKIPYSKDGFKQLFASTGLERNQIRLVSGLFDSGIAWDYDCEQRVALAVEPRSLRFDEIADWIEENIPVTDEPEHGEPTSPRPSGLDEDSFPKAVSTKTLQGYAERHRVRRENENVQRVLNSVVQRQYVRFVADDAGTPLHQPPHPSG